MLCENCETLFCIVCDSEFGCGHNTIGIGLACWYANSIMMSSTKNEKLITSILYIVLWPVIAIFNGLFAALTIANFVILTYGKFLHKMVKFFWRGCTCSGKDGHFCLILIGRPLAIILVIPLIIPGGHAMLFLSLIIMGCMTVLMYAYNLTITLPVLIYRLCVLKHIWETESE